jgi:hypothetical protein
VAAFTIIASAGRLEATFSLVIVDGAGSLVRIRSTYRLRPGLLVSH